MLVTMTHTMPVSITGFKTIMLKRGQEYDLPDGLFMQISEYCTKGGK